MTSSMGQRRWKESWSDSGGGGGHRRSNSMGEAGRGGGGGRGPGSAVSSLTDLSLERSNTRASFLVREHSSLSSHVDSTGYQEKLQGWSAVFHDSAMVAQRPGTSINAVRTHPHPHPHPHMAAHIDRDLTFLRANHSNAFPDKPRELYDPLDGILSSSSPPSQLVSQRKYYVLPSIGGPQDLFLRRQRTCTDSLNQLDYARDRFEDDADFFADLIELKRGAALHPTTSTATSTTAPHHHPNRSSANPLPPIPKLTAVVRPCTNIAELDEDHVPLSSRLSTAGMSDESDPEDFRVTTPDPDTSPRRLSIDREADSVFVTKSRGPPQLVEDYESVFHSKDP